MLNINGTHYAFYRKYYHKARHIMSLLQPHAMNKYIPTYKDSRQYNKYVRGHLIYRRVIICLTENDSFLR